ncbi:unnamed protein product, partial [Iphiclides podalirius]
METGAERNSSCYATVTFEFRYRLRHPSELFRFKIVVCNRTVTYRQSEQLRLSAVESRRGLSGCRHNEPLNNAGGRRRGASDDVRDWAPRIPRTDGQCGPADCPGLIRRALGQRERPHPRLSGC